jgi:hypothetical protein
LSGKFTKLTGVSGKAGKVYLAPGLMPGHKPALPVDKSLQQPVVFL